MFTFASNHYKDMRSILNFIKKFPISTLTVAAIWYVCFMNVPETPLQNISLIDKWTHVALYFVLGIIITFEYIRAYKNARLKDLALWVWLLPSLMGGLIEILQANCTGGMRSGEWMDFIADAIGATVALVIGILPVKYRAKS